MNLPKWAVFHDTLLALRCYTFLFPFLLEGAFEKCPNSKEMPRAEE